MKTPILVIDDDLSMRVVLEHFLKKEFQVILKSNPYDALKWLQEGNTPVLILLDLNLPQMSGMEFLELIKESGLYQDIPVIVLSCWEDQKLRLQCMEKGAGMYLTKPFNPEKILSVIRDFINQKNNQQYV